jgi:hypothetical protein
MKTYYPKWLDTFLSFPEPIQRADFFRWVALYHCGGCYVDMDCTCTSSLDSFIDELPLKSQLILPRSKWATNALIIAPYTQSALVYNLINAMKPSSNPFLSSKSVYGIFHSTGPAFVLKMLQTQPGVVLSDTLLWHVPGSLPPNKPYLAKHDGHGAWNFSRYLWNDIATVCGMIVLALLGLVFLLVCAYLIYKTR